MSCGLLRQYQYDVVSCGLFNQFQYDVMSCGLFSQCQYDIVFTLLVDFQFFFFFCLKRSKKKRRTEKSTGKVLVDFRVVHIPFSNALSLPLSPFMEFHCNSINYPHLFVFQVQYSEYTFNKSTEVTSIRMKKW